MIKVYDLTMMLNGAVWGKRRKHMYHYVEDKEFLKDMRTCCADIINQLVQRINNDSVMEVEAHLIGSGARNLITQNERGPVDLDYNLCIVDTDYRMNGQEMKEYVKKQFDLVLNRNGWEDCDDSTSALSTKMRYFPRGNPTCFKIDLGIVRKTAFGWERLVHEKTGWVCFDRWYWNQVLQSGNLDEKVREIKQAGLWLEVRKRYLQKKNMYLSRQDQNHPSFIVYIESINEVYYQYRY